jgi:hypothetical protein
MTEVQKKAAVILAVTDKIVSGSAAKPSGYWGVEPMAKAHELDDKMKDMSPEELAGVLDRLSGEVK